MFRRCVEMYHCYNTNNNVAITCMISALPSPFPSPLVVTVTRKTTEIAVFAWRSSHLEAQLQTPQMQGEVSV